MVFINCLVWIFTAPSKVFEHIIGGRVKWWQPWLVMSIIMVIIGFVSMPVQLAVMELNPNDMPQEQFDQQLEMTQKFGWISTLFTPLIVLVMSLIIAGLSYILVTILSASANFKRYFTLVMFSGVIGMMTYIISTIVVMTKGVDNIRVLEDAQFSISLGVLAPEGASTLLRAALSSIELFGIWGLVVLGMGLMSVFQMSRNQAIACCIPLWLITVLMYSLQYVVQGLGG